MRIIVNGQQAFGKSFLAPDDASVFDRIGGMTVAAMQLIPPVARLSISPTCIS